MIVIISLVGKLSRNDQFWLCSITRGVGSLSIYLSIYLYIYIYTYTTVYLRDTPLHPMKYHYAATCTFLLLFGPIILVSSPMNPASTSAGRSSSSMQRSRSTGDFGRSSDSTETAAEATSSCSCGKGWVSTTAIWPPCRRTWENPMKSHGLSDHRPVSQNSWRFWGVSAIQKVGKLPIYRDWQRFGKGKFLRFEKGDDVNPKVTWDTMK